MKGIPKWKHDSSDGRAVDYKLGGPEINDSINQSINQSINGMKGLSALKYIEKRLKKGFDQLLGARSTQKLVEIHNTPEL